MGRTELGQISGAPYDKLVAVGRALGARVELEVRWNGEALDRLLDAAHSDLVDAAVRRFAAAGWEVAVEASFAISGERGSIDVFALHPALELVAVCEIKSVVPDAQATQFVLDRKARLAPIIARERGWPCRGVAKILFIGESRTARRRIGLHAGMWYAAFPVRGRDVFGWINDPGRAMNRAGYRDRAEICGLAFLSAAHGTGRKDGAAPRHRIRVRHDAGNRLD